MMKKTNRTILSLTLALTLGVSALAGCGQTASETTAAANERMTAAASTEALVADEGGVLSLRVNPEIDIVYNANGLVTEIRAINADAKDVINSYTGYEGQECSDVIRDLVVRIGEAGYFVEEIDGEARTITLEIEAGSQVPDEQFLKEIAAEIREQVNENNWHSPLTFEGGTDYGFTDYVDTDYGPNNDGVTDFDATDYNDPATNYDAPTSPYDDPASPYDDPASPYDNDSAYDD